jgi:hypothetical protein
MKKFYISGNASKKEKEKIKKQFELSLNNQKKSFSKKDRDFFAKYEIKKTKKEIEIIKGLNKISNDIIRELGGQEYDIPLENIHFLSDERYFEMEGTNIYSNITDGFTGFEEQGIIIKINYLRKKSLIYFATTIFHEMLHLKGIIEVRFFKVGNKSNWFIIREGISVLYPSNKKNSNSKTYQKFFGLHEAVITYQEKTSFSDILNLPQLKKEKEWLESEEYIKFKKEKSKKLNYPEDEIIWIDEKNWNVYGYYWMRKLLEYILKEIQKEFPKYNEEEVFKEFLKIHFKRNHIRKVRKLVEKTFGKHSFMVLGSINPNINDVFIHFEIFKEFRKYQLKQKKKKEREKRKRIKKRK